MIDRAKARANLQGREWFSPSEWPEWMESRSISEGVIAEIVANLLENAFRYSPPQSSIGIDVIEKGICIWDAGNPIKEEEREKIFEKGFRGESGSKMSGLIQVNLKILCLNQGMLSFLLWNQNDT